jgi:ADP-dependent phosphofructokinase/glucokinase
MDSMFYKNLNINPKVRVATGLYSNLDSIVSVDDYVIKWLENSKSTKPKSEILKSMEEVVFVLKKSLRKGDSESFISKDVYKKLNLLFPNRNLRTGGNGNNMGKALFDLGLVPLVSYPVRSEKLMKASKNFNVACGSKIKKPSNAIRKNDPDYDHIIFESEKWRNILSWDLMTTRGFFDEDFLRLAFNPNFTDTAIIGYAHLILPKYKKRTDYLLDFIKKERPKIHLEFGLGCEESMRYAMGKFSENEACDSWGMDENECKLYLKTGHETSDMIEATLEAAKEYNLKRICIHSSRFAFSISKFNVEKEVKALLSAHYFTSIKASDKPGLQKGKIIKKKIENYSFCLVPSFFIPKPKKLTGLGDTFAAIQAVKILI